MKRVASNPGGRSYHVRPQDLLRETSRMISLNNEPCCICGQTASLLVQETTYPEHGYPGSFCLRKCATCGLLFNSPRLDDDELAKLYGKNYYFFSRADSIELPRIVPMYARTVALVADRVARKESLDIGCGRGYLPAVLKKLGWDAHGVEISSSASKYARKRFDLDVFTGTVEEYASSASAQRFPLVTAIDVIEHVPSPESFVEALSHVVEDDGLLILDTPNGAAYNIQIDAEYWPGFNPFHVFLFGIANLTQLLEKHGFVVEQSFSYHNKASDEPPIAVGKRAREMSIDLARALGVMGVAARAYFKIKTMSAPRGDVKTFVARAAEQIKSAKPYPQSTDANDTLSRDASGDNIVVIARKRV